MSIFALLTSASAYGQTLTIESATYDSPIEYSIYPLSQLTALTPCVDISGSGTNVLLEAIYTAPAGSPQTSSSLTEPTVSGPMQLCGQDSFTPTELGMYSFDFNLSENGVAATSTLKSFEVTGGTFARDRSQMPTPYSNGDDGTGSTNSYEAGNLFEFENDDQIVDIQVYIDPTTAVGALIYGVLYEFDGVNYNYMEQTADHTITANELGTWITLPMSIPTSVSAGSEFLAAAGHYGGPDAIFIGEDQLTAPAGTAKLLSGIDNTWYDAPNVLLVRVGVQNTANTETLTNDAVVQVYPNPSEGMITVATENSDFSSLEVVDFLGKSVMNEQLNASSTEIDLTTMPAGMYIVRLIRENSIHTQKVIIE